MRKESFACLAAFILVFLFVQKSYCQDISDSEAEMLVNQENFSVHDSKSDGETNVTEYFGSLQSLSIEKGRSNTWFSKNAADMNPLLGAKWQFSYRIISLFTDEISFGTIVTQSSTGTVGLSCSDRYGSTGAVIYGELPSTLGGGLGYSAVIYGTIIDKYFSFKISGGVATGYYFHQSKSTGIFSDDYLLTGIQLSGPSANISDNGNSSGDISNCKIMPKSMSISNSSIPTTSDYVNFTVSAISDCAANLYYYYSYAPDYGTDNYGQSDWVKMVSGGNGFSSNNSVSYKFPQSGYYVVVAWISPQMAPSNPINMIGCTVAVK